MKSVFSKLIDRVRNEPALVAGVVIAVGNLIGQDLTEAASIVETLVVFAASVFVRSKVTPVRKLPSTGD